MDERGVPLSIVVTGANRHDVSQLTAVLDARLTRAALHDCVVENLCADAGYAGVEPQTAIEAAGYDAPRAATWRRAG